MRKDNAEHGVGFIGLLTILFIALKLLGVIDWSWIWILSPIWISIALCILIIIAAYIYFGIKDK